MKEEQDQGQCSNYSQEINNNIQSYHQEQLLLHHHQQQQQMQQQNSDNNIFGGGSWSMPHPVHSFNPVHPIPSVQVVPPYANFFNRRVINNNPSSFQFASYEGLHGVSSSSDHHHLRIISDALVGPMVHHQPGPYGLVQAELGKMSAQEIMEAKALAASKSHSEAERRRRERINNHLAKLRSLLPNTTKTDKASLLAEVIQHVKELKRQTSLIAETSAVPTECDELTVDTADVNEDGKFVIKASLCCEDRSDLLPDLIKTLKALRLRTLRAEIATLAGRVKNVLFITCDDDNANGDESSGSGEYCSISSIQEALKEVMEKSGDDSAASGNVKRQRTNNNNLNNNNILQQRSL